MKLHIGSNGYNLDGWTNTDQDTLDIRNPLPYEYDSVEAIMISHVLEHVSGPDAFRFLQEAYRVLIAGGWLRISIPVIGQWMSRAHIESLATGHGHLACYDEHVVRSMLYGAGFEHEKIVRVDRDDRFDHHHKTIGDELDTLESCRLVATK